MANSYMNEQVFYRVINDKAKELGLNPLLLVSGIEGIYSFRNVELSAINYQFLDSLILTIFALRIGDRFHSIAEENLSSSNNDVMQAAAFELKPLSGEEIEHSANPYLQSFAQMVAGKSIIRRYHKKAIEVAALEVYHAHQHFNNESIGAIILRICQTDLKDNLDLDAIFGT